MNRGNMPTQPLGPRPLPPRPRVAHGRVGRLRRPRSKEARCARWRRRRHSYGGWRRARRRARRRCWRDRRRRCVGAKSLAPLIEHILRRWRAHTMACAHVLRARAMRQLACRENSCAAMAASRAPAATDASKARAARPRPPAGSHVVPDRVCVLHTRTAPLRRHGLARPQAHCARSSCACSRLRPRTAAARASAAAEACVSCARSNEQSARQTCTKHQTPLRCSIYPHIVSRTDPRIMFLLNRSSDLAEQVVTPRPITTPRPRRPCTNTCPAAGCP